MTLDLPHLAAHAGGTHAGGTHADAGPRADRLGLLVHDGAPLAPAALSGTASGTAPLSGQLATACVAFAGASIVGSIAIWATTRGRTAEERAHAERFGIFVGLWAPTFLGLAEQLRRVGRAPAR